MKTLHACGVLALSLVAWAPAGAQESPAPQNRPKYLDVMTVQIKPDKHADFHALVRKAVDANRRNKGDHWIAWGTAFGPGGTVYFTSPRASFADVEKASADFDRALKESLGPAAAKLGFDFDSCVERSRSEIRIFRWDLSRNAPEDSQEIMRTVANTRWVRTSNVEVLRAKVAEWEAAAPEFLNAMARGTPNLMTLVTQSIVGGTGENVQFHFATYCKSMADMDAMPTMRERMGDELFRKFQQLNAGTVARVNTAILRPIAELSNPPEFIVNVSRDFWSPKPPMTAARKARPVEKPAK